MSDFIQIGNLIINKAHIIDISYQPDYKEYYTEWRYPRLVIELTGEQPGEYGSETNRMTYIRNQAVAVWETLQNYLVPTVIHLPDLIEPEPEPDPTLQPANLEYDNIPF